MGQFHPQQVQRITRQTSDVSRRGDAQLSRQLHAEAGAFAPVSQNAAILYPRGFYPHLPRARVLLYLIFLRRFVDRRIRRRVRRGFLFFLLPPFVIISYSMVFMRSLL